MNDKKYTFDFSATYPKGHEMGGGTFIDGEFKCNPNDLPELLSILMQDMMKDVHTEKLNEQTFKLEVKPT
tara:strand:- start:227 stop:436 length:210 start_codon:yes stop_codon:yes gene_type:complete